MRLSLAPFALAALLAAAPSPAQPRSPRADTADVRVLRAVYRAPSPAFRTWMRASDDTAYEAFAAVPAGLGVYALAAGESVRPAARAFLAEAGAAAFVTLTKRRIRRPRPFRVAGNGVSARVRRARLEGARPSVVEDGSFSMPSGHTALAFAAATSLGLSHPEPYVVLPALVWASGVGLARVWHGVHYPSDVVAGAAAGFVIAGAVHLLLPDERGERKPAGPVVIIVRVPL